MLIVFAGIDGAGKTARSKALQAALVQKGYPAIWTREPGAGPVGTKIRNILLDPDRPPMAPKIELMLFLADRVEHVESEILPALRAGKIVISDRYKESSLVYQGTLLEHENSFRHGAIAAIDAFHDLLSIPNADVTFLVDIPPDVAYDRLTSRSSRDRDPDLETLKRYRQSYLSLTLQRKLGNNTIILDGTKPPADLDAEILANVEQLIRRINAP